MSEWMYQGTPIKPEEIPTKAVGFIYKITNKNNGLHYIGRKLLTAAKTKQVKGVKKKIRVDSGWQDYWSSSPDLLAAIEAEGKDSFLREIIIFCESKSEMIYAEESLLYFSDAILRKNWYNSNIRSKVYRTWFQKNPNFINTMKTARDFIQISSL